MWKRLKNKMFQSRDLCLRAPDTNSTCAKSVRRNEWKECNIPTQSWQRICCCTALSDGHWRLPFCSKRKKILQPRIFQSASLSGIRHNDGYSDPFAAGAGDKMAAAVSDHLDGRVRCGIFFRRDRSQNLEKAFVELRGCDTVWREEKRVCSFR